MAYLGGYGGQIWSGTLNTIALSLLALLLSFLLGLIGAAARLSGNRAARGLATAYTTLIRGVPDLVLMLLLFYSIQIWLNDLTDALGLAQFNLDPFAAGVIVLGFIYGAYFTETFRGAFLAVHKGQAEAGLSLGMAPLHVFRRIVFPQMMRHALPGLANNWQVILKATALVSLIGLLDIVQTTKDAGHGTGRAFFFAVLAGAIYLALTTVSNLGLLWLERRYAAGVREASL